MTGNEIASPSSGQRDYPVAMPVGPQTPVEAPFWEGLQAEELRMQHCLACGTWIWAPSWICPTCHSFDPAWEAVEPAGVVYSWIETYHVFPASREFGDYVPYLTALIELPHAGGRRLLGIVTDGEVRIGSPVRGWIQPASEMTGDWPVLRWASAGAI